MLPAVVAAVDLALELLLKQADKGLITTWSSVSAWIHFPFNTLVMKRLLIYPVCGFISCTSQSLGWCGDYHHS